MPRAGGSFADEVREQLPALAREHAEALGTLLQDTLAAARARWPSVRLEDGAFLRHLARHAPERIEALRTRKLEDLFLACACAQGDRAALGDLEERILSQVPRWIARFDGIDADDVQQDLRQRLLLGTEAHLLEYAGRGALDRWIRVAALRCAIDRQRRLKPVREDVLDDVISDPDPELDFIKLKDREALRAILYEVLHALPAAEMTLLRMHYTQGLSLESLAALERVSRSTVARRLAEVRATVLESVRSLLRERLRLDSKEGESLLRFLRSRLDISLRFALSTS